MDAQLRAEDWPERLADAIAKARLQPFAWGTHDCATWAFAVAARLRNDPPPEWVGTYKTELGAARRLKKAGLTLQDLGTAILGAPRIWPLMAQRGDVVFAGGAYGVCIGAHIAQVGPDGLVMKPLALAEQAWKV